MKKKLALLFSLIFLSGCSHLNPFQRLDPHAIHKSVGKIVAYTTVKEDGVSMEVPVGGGTGFAIGKEKILTANHVCEAVDKGLKLRLWYHNGVQEIKLPDILVPIKRSKTKDLCILYITKNPLKPIAFASRWPKMGDKVFIFGAPAHAAYVLTEGYYAHSIRIMLGPKHFVWAAALSVPAYAGNSGSPVLNERGELIGVLIAGHRYYNNLTFTPAFIEIKTFLNKR